MKRLLLLLAVVSLTGCKLSSTGPGSDPSDPATETFSPSLGVDIPSMTKTAFSPPDYYKDITIGTRDSLNQDEDVAFNYTGYLKDGTSWTSGAVTLNDDPEIALDGLIVGLQDGMLGMRVGGRRLIVVPSVNGYGSGSVTGTLATVPPNSTLIFDVTLTGLSPLP